MRHRGGRFRDTNADLIKYSLFIAKVEGWRNTVMVRVVKGQIFRFDHRMKCPTPSPHSIS